MGSCDLGFKFQDGQRLHDFKANLRSLFFDNPDVPEEVFDLATSPSSHSLGIALEMLNAQYSINLAARTKMFSKGKSI